MSLPAGVEDALGPVARVERIGGGCLADARRLVLEDGTPVFLKSGGEAAPGAFAAEAAGLRWLAAAEALILPEVLGAGEDPGWLALSWVEVGSGLDAAALGAGLARLHAAGAERFGTLPPGTPGGAQAPLRVGPLEVPNAPGDDWADFYAGQRLRPLAERAERQGALPSGGRATIEAVCERMAALVGPPEPVARLHGDLWSGNVLAGPGGEPVLIDPAAHGGHREIDLAMLRLFGSPGRRFLDAYEEVAPLAPGHEERVALFQLFPLLVHAVLFGGGYGGQAVAAARRYL
jgi:fructosamine-3-kinase